MIAIELPKGSVDEIREKDKAKLLERCGKVERELDKFIEDLGTKGYGVAVNYVSNAKRHLFTYLGTWLELGIRCPRPTSLIERLMREIGRRLKKIAFGWSESGAAKMARMVIARILNPKGWWDHWGGAEGDSGQRYHYLSRHRSHSLAPLISDVTKKWLRESEALNAQISSERGDFNRGCSSEDLNIENNQKLLAQDQGMRGAMGA